MTKIDIYSGFLGAGKTTLIKKMIQEAYAGQKVVLIENEFGEIGIDGGFLQEAGIEITEMNSGCICCSLVGDFGKALEQVIRDYAPDRILIEPSGVGKLSDVEAAVEKVVSDTVSLGNLVTVADAGKCKMYMKNFGEFYNNQVETAGTIVLSRTQTVAPEKLSAAVALLREKNPNAVIVTTPWDQLTGAQILEAMEQGNTLLHELQARHYGETHEDAEAHHCCHHDHDHDEDEHCCHHDHDHDERPLLTIMTKTSTAATTIMTTTRTATAATTIMTTTMRTAAAATTTTIITTTATTPTRCSPAGAWRRPRCLPRRRSGRPWRHWTAAASA